MSRARDAVAADPKRFVADLRRRLSDTLQANAELQRERNECAAELEAALAREAAIAEVMAIINANPGNPQPVFDTMLEKAASLCEAKLGLLCSYDGEAQILLASRGLPPKLIKTARRVTIEPTSSVGRLARGRDAFIHTPDITDDPVYRSGVPSRRLFAEVTGARTALWVALRKDDALIGVFIVYRTEVRPFTDKQIALLQNFAAQAVTAMENARLLTEMREALEQQTATAEVLGVINASPGNLQPVFDAMLDRALRLCEADQGTLWTFDGEVFYAAVALGFSDPAVAAMQRGGYRPGPKALLSRLLEGDELVHILDVGEETGYLTDAETRERLNAAGVRTVLGVALRKDGRLIGAITAGRRAVRAYTNQQTALMQSFAAQAVIAMENARLITETREALEQQTATAEVLGVINSSPGDLKPVFDVVLANALRLCDASFGQVSELSSSTSRARRQTMGPISAITRCRTSRPMVQLRRLCARVARLRPRTFGKLLLIARGRRGRSWQMWS
jgi:GAF domain-containing protein